MKVFGGHDGGSGCAYYRMDLPLTELGRHDGYEVTYADAGDGNGTRPPQITLSMLEGYDVIVAQRWNTHKGLEVWRKARTPYSRTVYELDDDVFSVTAENWNAYKLYGQPDVRDAITHAAETADLITVSTEPLAEVMRQAAGHDRVAVLPNCIPALALRLPRGQMRSRLRVGWAGGASHGVDIGIAADPVRRFLRRSPGWDLQLNGTDYRPTFKVPKDRAKYVPWTQVNQDPAGYYSGLNYDVGIAPIHPTTFSNSKSGLRALEHGARGIPTIASDVPAYRAVITHGVDGFLVRADHEWLRYMSILASDDELREKMGQAAREMAARHVIEDHWVRWRDAYEGLFRRLS